jgi:hypothetical protein
MRILVFSSVLIAVAMSSLPAQLTLPALQPERDAIGIPDPFPGTFAKLRQQILIGPRWLEGLQGRAIRAISFKRDGFLTHAMPAGRAQLSVRISSAAADPSRASPVFASNHGPIVEQAFAGTQTFPFSPALSHRDAADWSPGNVVRIDFLRPIPYVGGPLCIEIDGEPEPGAAAAKWRVDYQGPLAQGSVVHVGTACGAFRDRAGHMAFVTPHDLHVGSAPRFLSFSEPASASILFVGLQPLGQAVNLGFLGAPSCWFYVSPLLGLPAGASASAPPRVDAAIPFPSDAAFANVQFYVQWTHVGTRLTTSEALRVTLATVAPDLDAAVVTSRRVDGLPLPAAGFVHSAKMPVLRLHW